MTTYPGRAGEPPGQLSPQERALFGAALRRLAERGVPFLMAGGYVFSHYSGLWRDTKDLDVVVTGADFEAAVDVLRTLGLRDYYEVLGYDRSWIYRAYRDDLIVDVIHSFANHADAVDASWFARATPGMFAGEPVRFVAPEDLMWMKIFVFQRERCDWPDLLNVVRGLEGRLDWDHLLRRAGPHWRLLAALLDLYDWLVPAERHFIPGSIRNELTRRRLAETRSRLLPDPGEANRAVLLDSRPWLTSAGAGLAAPAAGPPAPPAAPNELALADDADAAVAA